ncbi:MAG: hypothetical protein WD273_11815 [Trueperaceae bacterium]
MASRVTAFDADVLIYSANPNNQLGRSVASLIRRANGDVRLIGSVLLVPELLMKTIRKRREAELSSLLATLSHLELLDVASPPYGFGTITLRCPEARRFQPGRLWVKVPPQA